MPPDLDPTREVYPNAPLQLVACEVSYTLAPGADMNAARDALYDALRTRYPLPAAPPVTLQVDPGASTPQVVQGFRFLDLERTQSIAVSPVSIVLEASRYNRFEEFRERVEEAVSALGKVLRVAAAQRIGLRYIDEVALTDLPAGTFDGYFAESLLAPGEAVPDVGEPVAYLTTSRYAVGPDRHTTMRTGVLGTPVVAPQGPLAIARPTSPPYFLIDIDSSWEAATTPPLPFDASAIVDILGTLHAPVRALFERSITEKLRDDMLRKVGTPA